VGERRGFDSTIEIRVMYFKTGVEKDNWIKHLMDKMRV